VPFQIRIWILPEGPLVAIAWTSDSAPSARDRHPQPLGTEHLEHPERPEARLPEVADRQEAKPAMQQLRRLAELLEMIGDHPVRQVLGPVHRRVHPVQDKGRAEHRVVDPRKVASG